MVRKTSKQKLHPADQYALDVSTGITPASKWVKKAIDRYYKDLKDADKSGYYFDAESAQAYIDFIELMPLTKGKHAGELLKLEKWQQFIIWNI